MVERTSPAETTVTGGDHGEPRLLILACGALARELRDITRLHDLGGVDIEHLPASLHSRPADIPGALRARLAQVRGHYDRILIGYADCGTAGEIDVICAEEGATRLPGMHCYEFFTGSERFLSMHRRDPTAFYLTDFLVRHFERIVLDGLGISTRPELLELYFRNYTKVVYLAQTSDPVLDSRARAAADALELDFERVDTGYGELATTVLDLTAGPGADGTSPRASADPDARPTEGSSRGRGLH